MHLLADWQDAEGAPKDLESIMKGLGMCIWSWPFTQQEADAYSLVSYCASGNSITLPHQDLGYNEQPNLFFEFLETYFKAKSDYQEKYRGSDQ